MFTLLSSFNVVGEMQKMATSGAIQRQAWYLVKPGAAISLLIIVAMGFLGLIGTVAFILYKVFGLLWGKGGIGKKEWKIFATALLICLSVTGGGIFSMFQVANRVAVEPGVSIIEQQDDVVDEDEDKEDN